MMKLPIIKQKFLWGIAGLLGALTVVPSGLANPFFNPCSNNGGVLESSQACLHAVPTPQNIPGQGQSLEKRYFRSTIRFRIHVSKHHERVHLKHAIASFVAKKLFPAPTLTQTVLLLSKIRELAHGDLSMSVLHEDADFVIVETSAKTLNRIANQLEETIHEGILKYRVVHVLYSGGTPSQTRFVHDNLAIPTDGIMNVQNVSDTIYRISQVPGFARVDAIFAPIVVTRDLDFPKNGIRFVIKSDKTHWTIELRKKIVYYVASRVLDIKTPFSRTLAASVANRASPLFWVPMDISFGTDNTFRVWVSRRLLERIKNALIEGAEKGIKEANHDSPDDPESDLREILSVENADHTFQDEPVFPDSSHIFNPGGSPDLENLFVNISSAATFSGSQIEVDNYGYAPTGAVVLNAIGNANNAGMAGGLFTVSASTSFGGINSGTVSYSLPLGLINRVGADFNAMNYSLGLGFSPWGHGANVFQLTALGVQGSNYSGDLWASQTLLGRQDRTLILKELAFFKEFQDTYSPTVQNDRSLVGGLVNLSGSRTFGELLASIDLTDTEYDLSQGAGSSPDNPFYQNTQGLQNYLTYNGLLQYSFTQVYSVSIGAQGQQSFGGGVIDPMLQATLGGIANVMALPTAALFGNNLYAGSITFSRTDSTTAGRLISSVFFNVGQVTGVGFQYSAMGPGIEEWWNAKHYFARFDAAIPVGALPTDPLGSIIPAATGGDIAQGGLPLQLWLSIGLRY